MCWCADGPHDQWHQHRREFDVQRHQYSIDWEQLSAAGRRQNGGGGSEYQEPRSTYCAPSCGEGERISTTWLMAHRQARLGRSRQLFLTQPNVLRENFATIRRVRKGVRMRTRQILLVLLICFTSPVFGQSTIGTGTSVTPPPTRRFAGSPHCPTATNSLCFAGMVRIS